MLTIHTLIGHILAIEYNMKYKRPRISIFVYYEKNCAETYVWENVQQILCNKFCMIFFTTIFAQHFQPCPNVRAYRLYLVLIYYL